MSRPTRHEVADALVRLDRWIERERFLGWDPHDALNSPLLKQLTFNQRLIGIVWVQLLRRTPINVRPLLGVRRGYNPKAFGLFLASYLRKHRVDGDVRHLERACAFADWLDSHRAPGYSGACWGYNFDWPNRGFFAPAGTPTIVNTAFIGQGFLDLHTCQATLAAEGDPAGRWVQPGAALAVARSACDFLLRDLQVQHPSSDELCFSYTPLDRRWIHNASVLGASLLAGTYAATGEATLAEHALAAVRYTARRQRADGSWAYGEGSREGWIDNFHTGFVLIGMRQVALALDAAELWPTLDAGYALWKQRFFEPDGAPRYYPDQLYPIDAHSIAQAVITFLAWGDRDPEARDLAWRVAAWGVRRMQDPRGYFHYQVHRRYRIRIPYMRWSQAWMQRALTELLADDAVLAAARAMTGSESGCIPRGATADPKHDADGP